MMIFISKMVMMIMTIGIIIITTKTVTLMQIMTQ